MSKLISTNIVSEGRERLGELKEDIILIIQQFWNGIKEGQLKRNIPFTKGSNSERVLSGPIALAMVVKFLIELTLRLGSSALSSSMRTPIGEMALPETVLPLFMRFSHRFKVYKPY